MGIDKATREGKKIARQSCKENGSLRPPTFVEEDMGIQLYYLRKALKNIRKEFKEIDCFLT